MIRKVDWCTRQDYNLRVGTAPGLSDIVSPMADANPASTQPGYRRIPAGGNANGVTRRSIIGLTPGQTYYWSVQAIDTAYAGSPFAPEQSIVAGNASIQQEYWMVAGENSPE